MGEEVNMVDFSYLGAITEGLNKDQVLLLLQIHHELTSSEIAVILRISEGTVKSRLHRARAKMNKLIQGGE
jgi:RNA polymerase sigma-70 factor (ECF subfamily)